MREEVGVRGDRAVQHLELDDAIGSHLDNTSDSRLRILVANHGVGTDDRPEGLDVYGLWFWYEHRSWSWVMIPVGIVLALAMQPFLPG